MALAFRRAVEEAQKAVTSTNATIKSSYKAAADQPFVVDFDGIKTVEGVSKQNPNSVEGPKNITLVNWVKDNASRFAGVWGDIQYKEKNHALPILLAQLDKVVLHVDDKSNGKKYNSYDARFEGKDLHIVVHIDFDNYPQQLSLGDEKNGVHVIYFLWDHLNEKANIAFTLARIQLESGSDLTNAKKSIKDKTKKDVPIIIHYEEIEKLAGKAVEYANKPQVPVNYLGVNFLTVGRGLGGAVNGVLGLCKDQMGVEAFSETFESIHIHVAGGSKESRSGPHEIKKVGKELHFHYNINFDSNLANASPDSAKFAKDIEALL
jgi:hypothetical protein